MAQSRSGSVVGSDRPVSEGKRTKSERRSPGRCWPSLRPQTYAPHVGWCGCIR